MLSIKHTVVKQIILSKYKPNGSEGLMVEDNPACLPEETFPICKRNALDQRHHIREGATSPDHSAGATSLKW